MPTRGNPTVTAIEFALLELGASMTATCADRVWRVTLSPVGRSALPGPVGGEGANLLGAVGDALDALAAVTGWKFLG